MVPAASHTAESSREQEQEQREADAQEAYEERRAKLQSDLQYKRDGLLFARQLKQVLPTIVRLFQSKIAGDVLEAIEFIVQCYQFDVPGADHGVRSVC